MDKDIQIQLDEVTNPWSMGAWNGRTVTFDGTATSEPPLPDPVRVLFAEEVGDDWDGTSYGIAQLGDGRFVSWESFYGPTGSGFSEDAYGGDADIIFSSSLDAVLRAFTDAGREVAARHGFALPE